MVYRLLPVVLLIAVGVSAQQPYPWFPTGDDARWSKVTSGPCTLIENVPIVAKTSDLSASDAALSSVVGYYNQKLPILGPSVPKRVEYLVSSPLVMGMNLNAAQHEALVDTFYELEDKNSRTFHELARDQTNVTDGAVRAHFLQKLWTGRIEETLQKLAQDRLQTVRVDRISEVSFSAVKRSISARTPAVLIVEGGKDVYTAVGYFEPLVPLVIVIDPDSALPISVPAEQVLLTEKDRRSSGRLATRAREALKGKTILVDQETSCRGHRPAGVRFLNLGQLGSGAEMYVVDWRLDTERLWALIRTK